MKLQKLDLSQKIAYIVSNIELTQDVSLINLLQRIENKLNEIIEELSKRANK